MTMFWVKFIFAARYFIDFYTYIFSHIKISSANILVYVL